MPKPPYVCMIEDCERLQVGGMLFCHEHVEVVYENVPFDAEPDDYVIMFAEKDGKRNVPDDPAWAAEVEEKRGHTMHHLMAWIGFPPPSDDDTEPFDTI